jgi:cell division septation protein DedD
MDDGNNPEHIAKGLSAGQMVTLFLAGAAVCALFFAAGFIVGYNEKSSTAAPVTEKLTEPSDIPPVVTQDSPRQAGEFPRKGSKEDKSASSQAPPEPLRPQPRSLPTTEVAEAQTKPELEPRLPPAVMPSKGASPATAAGGTPHATPGGPSASGVMIQVAATATKVDAEKMVKALQSLSYPAILVTPQRAHASDNLYRVQVGPYATREIAEKIRARLIHDGFKQPFIKH